MSESEEALQAEDMKKGGKSKKKAKQEDWDNVENNEGSGSPTQSPAKPKPKKKAKFHIPADGCNQQQTPTVKKRRNARKVIADNTDSSFASPEATKPKKRKPKDKNLNSSLHKNAVYIKEEIIENNGDDVPPNEKIDWPQKDLGDLMKRIELAIPDKDSLAYSTRAEKLSWDDIAFKEYTGEDCKKTWLLIQKRVRRFRLLSEVLQDAKEWISKPWTNFYRGHKTKRHPDMPRRPLSVYMIFYLKKKDTILLENPGLEMTEVSKRIAQMYKAIPPAKREKYMQLAADERKSYEEKLDEFYRIHPEISRYIEKPAHTKLVEVGPKKPLTPFGLYYEEQLKNFFSDSEVDRNTFKDQCKEQWKNMSDKKKVVWIDWALDQEAKYQDELKNYISQNPDFAPTALKRVLTKEEKTLKERLAGKPVKPPNSAYSLFSRMMLQSDAIKKIPPKDRMKAIADQWKTCTDKEKNQYKERASHMMEQYKLDFATYLESLPEEKRQEELQNNMPKRKKGTNEYGEPDPKKKKHVSPENGQLALMKIFEAQPAHPPVSGFSLFSKRYHGKLPVKTAWKNLSKLEKREYEAEVQKLKQKYIKEYEKFLKSLTKEQLTAFSQLKREKEEAAGNAHNKSGESGSSCESGSDVESLPDEDGIEQD